MYEGQQVIQATFRQTGPRMKPKIGIIEFDREGVYQFVGTPDSFEGLRNLLAFHGVKPDHDPLENSGIIPVNPATGEVDGEGGTGKATPPSEDYSDLDDLSEIKALKVESNVEAPGSADTGNGGQPQNRGGAAQPTAGADLRHGVGADSDAGPTQGAPAGGVNVVGAEAPVDDDDDADFSF